MPIEVFEHFELVDVVAHDKQIGLFLDEKATAPTDADYISKFTEQSVIQDFPLRGKGVFSHIRRRKWQNRLIGEAITNKSARGDKGAMIAMIKGTKSEVVLHYLNLLPRSLKLGVREITIDLSPSMKIIAKRTFPNATIVSDRFHVQKLVNEAISDLRVDTRRQLLARSRHIVMKRFSKWVYLQRGL